MRLSTGQTPAAEQRTQDLMMLRVSRRAERALAREIARAMSAAGKMVIDGEPMAADIMLIDHKRNMTAILTRLWTQSGEMMGERVVNSLKSKQHREIKTHEAEVMSQAIVNWIRIYAAPKITAITQTTRDTIVAIVSNGFAEGLTNAQIGRAIFAIAPTKSASRSQTIARTEVHGTSQAIGMELAQKTTIRLQKVWLSSRDDRTRRISEGAYFDHYAANEQMKDLDQPFEIEGPNGIELLMQPGDPAGSAGNVINCRCVVGYEMSD